MVINVCAGNIRCNLQPLSQPQSNHFLFFRLELQSLICSFSVLFFSSADLANVVHRTTPTTTTITVTRPPPPAPLPWWWWPATITPIPKCSTTTTTTTPIRWTNAMPPWSLCHCPDRHIRRALGPPRPIASCPAIRRAAAVPGTWWAAARAVPVRHRGRRPSRLRWATSMWRRRRCPVWRRRVFAQLHCRWATRESAWITAMRRHANDG